MGPRQKLAAVLFSAIISTVLTQSLECPRPNGYFPDSKHCDRFLECRDGVAEEKVCPDGLLVNEKAAAFRFPCDYPVDVDCGSRIQPAARAPTGNCPRLWGMFPVGDKSNCGQFVNCVDGKDHLFNCPEGLAWHPQLWRCEWPDQVPTCDAEAFLGFKCPGAKSLDILDEPKYRHPTNCARYFICVGGVSPRLQVCPYRTVFNPATATCDEPLNVPGCENFYPPEEPESTAVPTKTSG